MARAAYAIAEKNALKEADQQARPDDAELQIVSFRVGKEEFGLDILSVQEIIHRPRLTRVPNSPSFVDGVINLRGKVIPVIALHKRFGVPCEAENAQSRIVVLEIAGATFGFIVDSVPEVLRIPASGVTPPPRLCSNSREYVRGMAKIEDRFLILLDVDQILEGHCAHSQAVAPQPGK